MTDIIERLERQWAALDPVDEYRKDARDAIDEIERLRAELDDATHDRDEFRRVVGLLRAELDALKAQEPAAWIGGTDGMLWGEQCDENDIPLYRAPQLAIPDGWIATHLKTGNEYRVTGGAINATNAQDGQTMVIYERDGKTYVREASEFMEKFAAAPKPGDAK